MSIFSVKILSKRLLRALGIAVFRTKNSNFEPEALERILKLTGADTVLDVGANTGQFGDLLFDSNFRGTLISFEAIPSVHTALSARASNRKGVTWLVAPCSAIGRESGQIEFNIAANSVSSSILPMNVAHLNAAPESKYVDRQIVPVRRLDDIAQPFIHDTKHLFIKVDTQGYELEVLAGATELIPRTVALQLELSLVPLYEGAPTLIEMIDHLAGMGFELFNVIPNFWDIHTGRLLQVDGLFVRKSR